MPVLDEYLRQLAKHVKDKNAAELQQYLRVDPAEVPPVFQQLCDELKTSLRDSKAIDAKVNKLLPLPDDDPSSEIGEVWPGFQTLIKEFLEYWRDLNLENLVDAHSMLSSLTNTCITAFSHTQNGLMLLPATHQLCETLTRLAIVIDKQPELTRQLRKVEDSDQGEGKSLVESTAETIQRAFTMCLTERSSNRNGIKDGKPEGKKAGVYSFANMVLKLLFQCRKTRLANQLFTNISQHSPPLRLYSEKQRVTFLYYLGRFFFSNNHFYRAQACLQSSYNQCHSQFLQQKRLILIYLVASNMVLGRFPSAQLMARPEASGLAEKIGPIAESIRSGNVAAFKLALGPESGNEQWLFEKGILLPLRSRCEVLVWRSLARRVFQMTYQVPADPSDRRAPTLQLLDLVGAMQYCQKLLEGWQRPTPVGRAHTNSLFLKAPDLVPPPQGAKKLASHQGTIFGNKAPNLLEIEFMVASLVQQGLLHGFVSHSQGKFAIIGAKNRVAVNVGFPSVWNVLKTRAEKEDRAIDIPGWVQQERKFGMGGVVNLSGIARPVGSGG